MKFEVSSRRMIRTQVQLVPEQAGALKRAAADRGVSMAEIVREAIDRFLVAGSPEPRRRRAVEAVGGFRSGYRNISADHDQHLADTLAE